MTISDVEVHHRPGQMSACDSIKASKDASRDTIVYIGGFELPDKNAAAQRVMTNAQIFQELGYRVLLVGLSRSRPADGKLYPANSGATGLEAWEMGYPDGSARWFRQILSDAPLRKLLLQAKVGKLEAVICYNHPAISQWRIMDGLITTSPFISDFYRRHGMPIIEIPTLMAPEAAAQVPAIDRSDGITRLFFAGTGFDKTSVEESSDGLKDRLDWVFEVLHKAKMLGARFHMDLFGVDRAQYLELVPEQAEILKAMEGDLTFHGRQPRKTLLKILPQAAFSIFFRKTTRTNLAGFPSKLAESISYGTPTITNPMPSSSQFMIEGRIGHLIEPLDPDHAAEKIVKIFDQSDAEINAMKAYCYSSDIFHYRSFIRSTFKWLSNLHNR